MQSYLQELKGTLARTQQKKDTTVSKIAKQRDQSKLAERLGVVSTTRPNNPAKVDTVKAAKFFLNQVTQEVSSKISRLNNDSLVSIEKDGEVVVRNLNGEVNRLIVEHDRWRRRVEDLGDGSSGAKKFNKNVKFFGAAKQLPEALEKAEKPKRSKRQRDDAVASAEKVDDDDDEEEGDFEDNVPDGADGESEEWVSADDKLRSALPREYFEKRSEATEAILRRDEAVAEHRHKAKDQAQYETHVEGYVMHYGDAEIPTTDQVRSRLLEVRKQQMLARVRSHAAAGANSGQ